MKKKNRPYKTSHKPREMRGPIETQQIDPFFYQPHGEVTSRAKCAALLKRLFFGRQCPLG